MGVKIFNVIVSVWLRWLLETGHILQGAISKFTVDSGGSVREVVAIVKGVFS